MTHRLRPAQIVALVIAALAVVGIQRIRVDDSLSQLFRSHDLAYEQFKQVSRDFPSSEYDVLIVVSGDSLLARESVDKLRDFVADVQLIDGTRGALSMFSARLPAPQGGLPAPLFPEPLPEGAGYHALIDRVKANEIVRGKLLSEDGRRISLTSNGRTQAVSIRPGSGDVADVRIELQRQG